MIILVLLLVLAGWFAYLSYEGDGKFNAKQGLAALATLAVAAWAYLSDFASSIIGW
jgi:hypothetical protein